MRSSLQCKTVASFSVSLSSDRTPPLPDLSTARLPHFCKHASPAERSGAYSVPETWFEPRPEGDKHLVFVKDTPGKGYVHAVTFQEIKDYLQFLPPALSDQIASAVDVIKLSGRTRKNAAQNLYGLQWGSAVYLYPFNESLRETYGRTPPIATRIQTERYGGRWSRTEEGDFQLRWTKTSLRDFYLCEVLMHEIGHVLDNRNVGYRAREQFADAFATEHGYLPWKARQPSREINRRHHN